MQMISIISTMRNWCVHEKLSTYHSLLTELEKIVDENADLDFRWTCTRNRRRCLSEKKAHRT